MRRLVRDQRCARPRVAAARAARPRGAVGRPRNETHNGQHESHTSALSECRRNAGAGRAEPRIRQHADRDACRKQSMNGGPALRGPAGADGAGSERERERRRSRARGNRPGTRASAWTCTTAASRSLDERTVAQRGAQQEHERGCACGAIAISARECSRTVTIEREWQSGANDAHACAARLGRPTPNPRACSR